MEPITPEFLLHAYAAGLFPMADSAEGTELGWYDPPRRGVFPLDGLAVSRSLAKTLRADRFEVVADRDFDAVIDACAAQTQDRRTTWINAEIKRLYRALFDRGAVHTIEVYREGALVGGLYGVSLRAAFFGESMFHRASDASKIALVHLFARLRAGGFALLDAQMTTPHLESLGAVEISRREYRRRLADALGRPAAFPALPGLTGAQALELALQGPASKE